MVDMVCEWLAGLGAIRSYAILHRREIRIRIARRRLSSNGHPQSRSEAAVMRISETRSSRGSDPIILKSSLDFIALQPDPV